MAYDPAKLQNLKTALQTSAPTMSAALNDATADQVVSLLNPLVPASQASDLDAISAAVSDIANVDKVKAIEAHWKNYPPAAPSSKDNSATPKSNGDPAQPSANGDQVDKETNSKNAAAARLLQNALQNGTAVNLAYITTGGFFLLVFGLMFMDWRHVALSEQSPYRDILMTLMGVIGTGWAGIISFYFGSSVGSRQQSETLQAISRDASTAQKTGS